jgi:hypothetical protein
MAMKFNPSAGNHLGFDVDLPRPDERYRRKATEKRPARLQILPTASTDWKPGLPLLAGVNAVENSKRTIYFVQLTSVRVGPARGAEMLMAGIRPSTPGIRPSRNRNSLPKCWHRAAFPNRDDRLDCCPKQLGSFRSALE